MADPNINANLLKPQQVGSAVSEEAFTAEARGQAAMGGAIQKAGGALERISAQRQQAENEASMAELRRDLRERAAEVERSITANPDENSWLDSWNQEMDSFGGSFMGREGLSPQVRRDVEIYFNDFKSNGAQDIQTKALRQTFSRAEQSALMDAESALAHGDIDGALGAVNGLSHKLPEWKDRMGRELTRKHEMNQIEATMETDPWALDNMEKPEWMMDSQWEKIQTARNRKKAQIGAEAMDDLSTKVIGGNIISKDVIDEMIENDPIIAELPEEERIEFRNNLMSNAPLDRDELAGQREMIESIKTLKNDDQITPEAYEESYHFGMQALARFGNRKGARDLREELAEHSPDAIAQRQNNATENRVSWQKDKLYSDWHSASLTMKDSATADRITAAAKKQMEIILRVTPPADIIAHDANLQPGEETWMEKKGREVWTQLQIGKGRQQVSDIVWDEEDEIPAGGHGLLPPKTNLLGKERGQ